MLQAISLIASSINISSIALQSNATLNIYNQTGSWIVDPETGNSHKSAGTITTITARLKTVQSPDDFVVAGKDTSPLFLEGYLVSSKRFDFTNKLIEKIRLIIGSQEGDFILYPKTESFIERNMGTTNYLGQKIAGYWLT